MLLENLPRQDLPLNRSGLGSLPRAAKPTRAHVVSSSEKPVPDCIDTVPQLIVVHRLLSQVLFMPANVGSVGAHIRGDCCQLLPARNTETLLWTKQQSHTLARGPSLQVKEEYALCSDL